MNWQKEFDKIYSHEEYCNYLHNSTLRDLKAFISQVHAAALSEGKAYWEPSEHHKDIWRAEGYRNAIDDVQKAFKAAEVTRFDGATMEIFNDPAKFVEELTKLKASRHHEL